MEPKVPPDRLSERFNLEQPAAEPQEPIDPQHEARLKHLQRVKIERFLANTPKQRMSSQVVPSQLRSYRDLWRRADPEAFNAVDESILESVEKSMMQQAALDRRRVHLDRALGSTASQIIRGRLGVDNLFLAFGLLGVVLIPWYFSRKFTRRRERLEQLPAASGDLDARSRDATFFDSDTAKRQILERERIRVEKKRLEKLLGD